MKKLVSSIAIISLLCSAPISAFAASDPQPPQPTQSVESIISPATASKTVNVTVSYHNVNADFKAPSTFFYVDSQWAGTLKLSVTWMYDKGNGLFNADAIYEGTVYKTGPMNAITFEQAELKLDE